MHRTTAAPRRLRRRLLVAVAVALLVVLLLAAATWYFSGEIRKSALDVTAAEPTYDLVVTAVDGDTVTLDDSADPHPSLRDGHWVYGLRWKGGAGQVSGTVEEDGDTVTRQFQVDEGSAPEVGTKVALNRDIVVERPDPPFAQVTYRAGGADVPAWFAPGDSDTWAVLVHGKGGSPAEMARMAVATTEAGLPSLLIEYRNDPGAPSDPSGHYGYGATEWHDLADAVSYAQAQGARHVVLGGASMGGAVVASYLEQADPPRGLVGGVVLDAPMLDLDGVVDHGAEEKRLPGFLTSSAEWLSGVRFGIDWDAVDYLDDTSWASVPVLVLHGTEDDTVPVTVSRTLASEQPDTVQLEEFDADHVEAFNSDPDRYLRTVGDFLDRVTR